MTTVYPSLDTHASNDSTCPALWDALREVTDPEIPISVVDMGLIVAMAEQSGIVDIKLTFTAMGCPAMDFIMMIYARACCKSQACERCALKLCGIPCGRKQD